MPLNNITNHNNIITVANQSLKKQLLPQLVQNKTTISARSSKGKRQLSDIQNTRNDIVNIAKRIKIYSYYSEDINNFCDKFENQKLSNLDEKTAGYFYKYLGECFTTVIKYDFSRNTSDTRELTQTLNRFFANLKGNTKESLTQALLADAITKSSTLPNASTKMYHARVKAIEAVILDFVESHNIYLGEEGKNEYVKAYKNVLKKRAWEFSDMFKVVPLPKHIENDIMPLIKKLEDTLNTTASFSSLVHMLGDDIYRSVQAFVASQNSSLSFDSQCLSSHKDKLALAAFLKKQDIPISLYSVIEKNGESGIHKLQNNPAGIYGAVIEALANENSDKILFNIEALRIAPMVFIKAYKDFFWVELGRGARGALTLDTLITNDVTKIVNVKLLQRALKNSPVSFIKEVKFPICCENIAQLFDDFYDEKVYSFFKLYLSYKLINFTHIDDNGNTFSHAIVYHNDLETWERYKQHAYVLINTINNAGVTAFQLAMKINFANMVLNLLDCKKIDADISGPENTNALDMTLQMNSPETIAKSISHDINILGDKRRFPHVDAPAIETAASAVHSAKRQKQT